MVLNADARRSRAVARLARWAYRHNRTAERGLVGWFAVRRYDAAVRHVERVAGRDVAAGRLNVDLAAHRVPTRDDDRRTGYYLDAAAAYNLAAVRAATALIDAAAERADDDAINRLRAAYADDGPADLDAAAAEGVRRAPGRAEVHDHDHDDRRW